MLFPELRRMAARQGGEGKEEVSEKVGWGSGKIERCHLSPRRENTELVLRPPSGKGRVRTD